MTSITPSSAIDNICINLVYPFMRNPFLIGCKKRKNKTCQSRFVLAMLKQHIELVISIYYAYKAYLHISRRMLNVLGLGLGLACSLCAAASIRKWKPKPFPPTILGKTQERQKANERKAAACSWHNSLHTFERTLQAYKTLTYTHTNVQTHWHAEQAGWQDKGEAWVQRQSASWSAHLF